MRKTIVILLVIVLLVLVGGCSQKKQSGKDENGGVQDIPTGSSPTLEEVCWEKVTDCDVEEREDGSAFVTLTAPDYAAIVRYLSDGGITEDVTVGMITDAISNNPDAVKEYSFVAKTAGEEDVRAALMEQIAYELVGITLEDIVG